MCAGRKERESRGIMRALIQWEEGKMGEVIKKGECWTHSWPPSQLYLSWSQTSSGRIRATNIKEKKNGQERRRCLKLATEYLILCVDLYMSSHQQTHMRKPRGQDLHNRGFRKRKWKGGAPFMKIMWKFVWHHLRKISFLEMSHLYQNYYICKTSEVICQKGIAKKKIFSECLPMYHIWYYEGMY